MAKKKILIIDFDHEFVKFLSRALTEEGYEVITAADGLAGFEKFSEIHPDLVIMEAMLPKFHGFELCSRITSHPTKKSPVIIITGIYKDSVYKTEALKSLGASAYFEKPLNLEDLKSKIYELLGKPEIKKHISPSDQDLDQLLKEALQESSITKKQTITPAKKEVTQKTSTPSKDEEIDLILKSKLKDIISDTSAPEPKGAKTFSSKTEKVITNQVQTPTAKKPEPVTRPAQSDTSQGNKLAATVSPPIPKKIETAVSESKSEPKKEIKAEPRVEQKSTPPLSAEPEKPKASAAPIANPFKGYITENQEDEGKKKSSRLFIGIAAAVLIVIAAVALFSLKKKESPSFNNRTSNQVAALQTSGSEQPKDQSTGQQPNTEENLNKEIENQMAAYRQQKAQSAATKASPAGNKNQNLPQKTVNKIESAPVAAAPVLPQETPKLAENLNTNQSPIAANPENSATTVNNNQTTQSEVTAPTNQAKAEEKPVAIPTQKAKTGDLLPLSMVDVEPKIIKTVEPVYPDADRRLGIKGNVILNVLISENGEVLEAVVIRGIRGSVGVEKEAINAVKKWKFLPAEKDGVKVKVWKPITIGFGLNK